MLSEVAPDTRAWRGWSEMDATVVDWMLTGEGDDALPDGLEEAPDVYRVPATTASACAVDPRQSALRASRALHPSAPASLAAAIREGADV